MVVFESQTPLAAINDMGSEGSQKIGAAIYLKRPSPLRLSDFASDFRKRWSGDGLIAEGREGNCVFFSSGLCHFAIEFRPVPIPQAVTSSVVSDAVRYWPSAGDELAPHLAHLNVAANTERGTELGSARILTKVVTSLLSVTDSIGVCWLNGPVLQSRESFVAIATEMFGAGVEPLILWVAAQWKPQDHILHTKGMGQFQVPEVLIAQQAGTTPQLLEYLFEVASYVLTSGKEIVDGETMDGPEGVFQISSIRGSEPSKTRLMLMPVRPS